MKFRSDRLRLLACVVGAAAPAIVGMVGVASAADETFSATTAITLPGGQIINGFDISDVDATLGLYALGDRTNKAVDLIDTGTNTLLIQLKAGFKGATGNNNTSGPDGVLFVSHREVWVGDGDSTVKVIDLFNQSLTHTISTGGANRADELCFDPRDELVLVANNAEAPFPFGTLISTDSYSVVKRITFDGSNNTPIATNGAEQCQWNKRTGKFYISIPEINGPGNNSVAGGVAVIDPKTMSVEKTFVIPVANCSGPQGMAIGPDHQILLGCNGAVNANASTVVIDERDGKIIKTFNQESGSDEVWFNPGDNHYFLARSSAVGANQALGVIDAEALSADASVFTATKAIVPPSTGPRNAHSLAADPIANQVYVPIPAGVSTVCSSAGGVDAQGCIAVFTTPHDDKCFAEGGPVIRVSGEGDEDHMREGCRRHHHDD